VRTATAITGDRESGRDAVNDAFVAAIGHRGQFRGEKTLDAWVWRVVEDASAFGSPGTAPTREHTLLDERPSR
jgi:hypothetical protein